MLGFSAIAHVPIGQSSLIFDRQRELTGVAGTSAVGTISPTSEASKAITGVSALGVAEPFAGANTTYTVTVQSTGSGNKYYINGVQQATLSLIEGVTYVFDQSDSSNSGHPLRFSTTDNGTHNSGTEYTTGVTTSGTPGSSGAFTQIIPASGAPTLYYYCTNHSAMGGTANTLAAGSSVFDAEASISITGVAGTSAVNAPTGIFSKQLSGVAATGAVNLPAGAFTRTASVILSGALEADGLVNTPTFSQSQSPTLTGVSMTLSHGSASDLFDADANKTITGVAGTSAVSAVTFDAKATNTPVSVVTTGSLGTLTQTADARQTLTGNATTSAIAALTTRAAASATLTGAEVIGIAERDTTANGNLFDYGPFADNYSRVRTFTVTNGASSTDNKVYITI